MQNNSNELSIPELARRIENQLLDSRTLDKKTLQKCAMFFKSRGYSNEDISEILKVSSRTIERYLKNMRTENSFKLGINFQQELLGEKLNNLRSCYQRLLRLSYSCNVSDYEKARIIFMCQQVEINGIALLSQLGYLSKEQSAEDINFVKEQAEDDLRKSRGVIKKQLEALNIPQDNAVRELWQRLQDEAIEQVKKMVDKFTAENEKLRRGASQLVCSVTVLCN